MEEWIVRREGLEQESIGNTYLGENRYNYPLTDCSFLHILGWVTVLMITQFLVSWFVLQKKLDVFHWALYELLERQYQEVSRIYPFACFYVHRSVKPLSSLLKSIKVFHYVLNESKKNQNSEYIFRSFGFWFWGWHRVEIKGAGQKSGHIDLLHFPSTALLKSGRLFMK